jgi:hypothetical protein
MAREKTKVKICISLDEDLHEELKKKCDKRLIKLSSYINHVLRENEK